MKNNVIEILNFILKKCAEQPKNISSAEIMKNIMQQLEAHGFTADEVQDAFAWFLNLLMQQYPHGEVKIATEQERNMSKAVRLFVSAEVDKFSEAGCSFILFLENTGVLNSKNREIVITQLMQMQQPQCSLDEIKWVALMVLLMQNDHNVENQFLENCALYFGQQYEC